MVGTKTITGKVAPRRPDRGADERLRPDRLLPRAGGHVGGVEHHHGPVQLWVRDPDPAVVAGRVERDVHDGDVRVMARWAERMAGEGIGLPIHAGVAGFETGSGGLT